MRIVGTIYLLVALVVVIFASGTYVFFGGLVADWLEIVRGVVLGSSRAAVQWTLDTLVWIGLLGLASANLLLAEQFLSHAYERGWRMPSRALWRSCQIHAILVLGWLVLLLVEEGRHMSDRDVFRVILPVFAIALTKLVCATLVVRESRPVSDGD